MGACALFFGGGEAGSPSNTMWPGPRCTSGPSGILSHPTVWPQLTNVTDRQTGQTGQTDRQTTVQQDTAKRFTKGRPITTMFTHFMVCC